MDDAGVERREIAASHPRLDLTVERVADFERDLLALANFDDRGDVGMLAGVADIRFGGERLAAIDADAVHRCTPSIPQRQGGALGCRALGFSHVVSLDLKMHLAVFAYRLSVVVIAMSFIAHPVVYVLLYSLVYHQSAQDAAGMFVQAVWIRPAAPSQQP